MQVNNPQFRTNTYNPESYYQNSNENPEETTLYSPYDRYEQTNTEYHSRSNPFNRENFLSGDGMYAGQLARLLSPSMVSVIQQGQDRERESDHKSYL